MLKIRLKASSEFVVSMICLLIISLMLIFSVYLQSDISSKITLDSTIRKYLLQLESNGNMNDLEKIEFTNRIKQEIVDKLGDKVDASSIIVEVKGNTYGNNVSIKVACSIKLKQNKGLAGFIEKNSSGEYVKYEKELTSTSKT